MIFAHTTTLTRDGEPVVFLAGAEVPEWAENEVGPHLLAEAPPRKVEPAPQDDSEQTAGGAPGQTETGDDDGSAAEDVADDAKAAEGAAAKDEVDQAEDAADEAKAGAPDFTGPAKPARGRSQRSR